MYFDERDFEGHVSLQSYGNKALDGKSIGEAIDIENCNERDNSKGTKMKSGVMGDVPSVNSEKMHGNDRLPDELGDVLDRVSQIIADSNPRSNAMTEQMQVKSPGSHNQDYAKNGQYGSGMSFSDPPSRVESFNSSLLLEKHRLAQAAKEAAGQPTSVESPFKVIDMNSNENRLKDLNQSKIQSSERRPIENFNFTLKGAMKENDRPLENYQEQSIESSKMKKPESAGLKSKANSVQVEYEETIILRKAEKTISRQSSKNKFVAEVISNNPARYSMQSLSTHSNAIPEGFIPKSPKAVSNKSSSFCSEPIQHESIGKPSLHPQQSVATKNSIRAPQMVTVQDHQQSTHSATSSTHSKSEKHKPTDPKPKDYGCPMMTSTAKSQAPSPHPQTHPVASTLSTPYTSSRVPVQPPKLSLPSSGNRTENRGIERTEGSHSAKSNPKTVKAVSPKPSITPAESHERTHLAVDGPLFEMKLEEICSRLKFIVKKPFACAKVMLHLLREVLLSDSKTVHVLCSKGADIAVALSRLQSCVQRSEAIAKEIHSEDPCSVQITNALITSMKEASKELLDSIRAAGYNTLDSRSKHSSEMSKDGSKIDQYQSSLNHHKKSVVKTITTHPKEEEKIVHKVQIQSHLKQVPIIENFPQFPKQAHSLPKNLNQHNAESTSRQFADYSDVEKAAHLICDHKLSFRVCSMTKLRKQIFLGFEDGAISMVTLSPTYNINLDKCIRYSTEPVTQMICIDLQDKRNGEYLITASGMRDPVIVVWDIATFKPIAELKGHSQFITCLQRVGEGFFASCSFDKSIRVWDCQSWHCVNSLYFHEAPIISCCYSPELNLLATGDLSGAVNVSSPTIEEGKFRSCATYTKFKGCGPILELCFDSHRRLVSFENSKMRVYDCRGTLFKELKCPFFVSTVRFVDHNNILLVDMTGRPNWIDYEQALCDTTLPRPLLSSHQDDIELASKTISQRVTGGLPKAQFVKSGDSLMVYSLCPDGHTLRIHGLN
jgi:WD40 repeat protein